MKTLLELHHALPLADRPAGAGLMPLVDAGVSEIEQLTPGVLDITPGFGTNGLKFLVMALTRELQRVERQAEYAADLLDEAGKHIAMITKARA